MFLFHVMCCIYIFFNGSGLVKADVSFYVCFCFQLPSFLDLFGLPGFQGHQVQGPGPCRQNTMTRSIAAWWVTYHLEKGWSSSMGRMTSHIYI